MMMELDIVKQGRMDAMKAMKLKKKSLIALVMNLVAPVDILRIF
jgi:hypothetical protein